MKKRNAVVMGIAFCLVLSALIVYAVASDSDNGFVIGIQGNCTGDGNTGVDYCQDSDNLTEYWISGGECRTTRVPCSQYPGGYSGCVNGACVY